MNDNLTPDTAYALLNATQGHVESKHKMLKNVARTGDIDKTVQAAEEFEAMFVSEMLKPMFEGIETSAPFGGGKGEEVFRGFMLQEYGKIIARAGGIGLSDQVREEMIRLQGQADTSIQTIAAINKEDK